MARGAWTLLAIDGAIAVEEVIEGAGHGELEWLAENRGWSVLRRRRKKRRRKKEEGGAEA